MLLFLLPPSERKASGGMNQPETLRWNFEKPHVIATGASEKDLKCSGIRYTEGMHLNNELNTGQVPTLPAIKRYTGIMFGSLQYQYMLTSTQDFFNQHTLICSGMYGILTPQDLIGNYKLPIQTAGLYQFRNKQKITNTLIDYARSQSATLIDLLPGSYKKMFDGQAIQEAGIPVIPVNFYKNNDGILKKLTHTVKAVKGAWVREMCEKQITQVNQLGGIQLEDEIQIVID